MNNVPRPPGYYAPPRTGQLSRRNRILLAVGVVVVGLAALVPLYQVIFRQAAKAADVHVPLTVGSTPTLDRGASGVTPGLQRTRITLRNVSGNGPPPNAASPTKQMVVEVLLENTGKLLVTGEPWRLRDTNGHEYAPNPAANIPSSSSTPALPDRYTLYAGQQVQGIAIFDIPANATVSWLRYGITGPGIGDVYFDAP